MIVPWRFITYLHLVVFFLMGFHVGKIPVPWIDFGGVLDDFASEGCFGVVFGEHDERDHLDPTPQPGRDNQL